MSNSAVALTEALTQLFAELQHEKILVVCSRGLTERFELSAVLRSLESKHHIKLVSIDSRLPDLEAVERLRAQTRDFFPQTVLAIGGGTVMDVAKSYCFFSDLPTSALREVAGSKSTHQHNLHLILMPTLFGSGAESTHHGVLYVDGIKHSIVGSANNRQSSILVPELALTATSEQRLYAGFDAVCQSIEAALSVLGSVEDKDMALKQLDILLDSFDGYVDGTHPLSVSRFACASSEVGTIMNSTKTAAPHAASYFLTSNFDIPHGLAVALTAGAFFDDLRHNQDSLDPMSVQVASRVNIRFLGTLHGSFDQFIRSALTARKPLLSFEPGALWDGLQVLDWAESVDQDRISNHPRKLDREAVQRILQDSKSRLLGLSEDSS